MNTKWVFAGLAAWLSVGCATQSGGLTERDRVLLEGRIADLEASDLRSRTKIASLERSMSQLEEKVSLLSRRTSLEAREVVRVVPTDRPSPHVEQTLPQYDEPTQDDVYQELVISDDKKRAYFGQSTVSPSTSGAVASGQTGPRRAYENVVTDDRLPAGRSQAPAAVVTSPMMYYQEGIDLYRRGAYAEGRTKFQQFLAANPGTEYIDNALYWIGECYYGEGLFNEAAANFHRIIQDYPTTNKVPDALLKVSLTYLKLGRPDSAREMLHYLFEAFPGSEAARIGKARYETLLGGRVE